MSIRSDHWQEEDRPELSLRDVGRVYDDTPPVIALRGVTLEVRSGEFIAIEGPSGGGKSTLLNVLGLLDRPTTGGVEVSGVAVGGLDEVARSRLRSDHIGFIFQNFHLLDRRPVIDSVELGLLYRGLPSDVRWRRSADALEDVGLEGFEMKLANTLSGGQRQRVAIARAIASGAPVILADEPTGNLDSHNSKLVMDSLSALRNKGAAIVMVTHSPKMAEFADRRFALVDGRLAETGRSGDPAPRRRAGVPGKPSRISAVDIVFDTVRNLRSRVTRTVALISAVAFGVGLAVATGGISQAAQAQVSDAFDSHLNRDVTAQWDAAELDDLPQSARISMLHRLYELRGVSRAAIMSDYDSKGVQVNRLRPVFSAALFGATSDFPSAARMDVTWAAGHARHLGAREVLVGRSLNTQLNLANIDSRPIVHVGSRMFLVAGIIETSPRLPQLISAIGLRDVDAQILDLGKPRRQRAMILTMPGAAQQVARQVSLVIDPYRSSAIKVTAPIDPAALRQEVEGSVSVTLLVVTLVALVGSVAGLANAMTLAVGERKQEIGLRRALGALPRHISAMILVESVIVGLVGGLVGLAGGLAAILATTISQHWVPVFDLLFAPAAVAGGIVVGASGGFVASLRATRIQPTEALRL